MRSRIASFSSAAIPFSPKCASAPSKPAPATVGRPLVRFRNSVKRSRILTGTGQPSANMLVISADA